MGDRNAARKGLLVAATILACAPATARAQTLAAPPDPAARRAAPPAKAAGPFGLSPETMAQARRIADEMRAATQAAARQVAKQVAEQLPKPQTAPPPAQAPAQTPVPAQPAGPSPLKPVVGAPAPTPLPPASQAARAPLRGSQGPPPSGIDWGLALAGQRRSAEVGPRAVEGLSLNLAAVNRTAVPILLLRGALIDGARIYSFGDYYSITADMPGARISLTGTTTTATLPASTRLTTSPGAEQLVVQRTVDGQLASFVRYGVLYTVELRCDAPDDARCKTDAVVRDLMARDTIVVFGKAARQAAGMGG